jgi:hypothetical protein
MHDAVDDGTAFDRTMTDGGAAEIQMLRGGGKRIAEPGEGIIAMNGTGTADEAPFARRSPVENRKRRGRPGGNALVHLVRPHVRNSC